MKASESAQAFEIAYLSALRLLDQQHSNLNELRARAAGVLTASSLVVAVLGTSTADIDSWGWAGLGVFAAIVAAAGAVLWPTSYAWVFGPSPSDLIAEYLDGETPASTADVYRDQALHLHTSADENAARLRWRYGVFRLLVLLLGAELVLLFLDARGG